MSDNSAAVDKDVHNLDNVEIPLLDDHAKPESKKNKWLMIVFLSGGAFAFLMIVYWLWAANTQSAPPPPMNAGASTKPTSSGDKPGATAQTTEPELAAAASKEDAALRERKNAESNALKGSFVAADPFDNPAARQPMPENRPQQEFRPPPQQPIQQASQQLPADETGIISLWTSRVMADKPQSLKGNDAYRKVSEETFALIAGRKAGSQTAAADGFLGASSGSVSSTIADVVAGKRFYGRITNELTSLVPQTPATGEILSGPFKGAKLVGSAANQKNRYLTVTYDKMSWGGRTYAVQVQAQDLETGSAALADEVESHVVARTAGGAILGGTQALGAAIMKENTTSNTSMGVNGVQTQTTQGALSDKQKAWVFAGGAGNAVTPAWGEYQAQNLQPEVKIFKDKEVQLMFMQPFYLNPPVTTVSK